MFSLLSRELLCFWSENRFLDPLDLGFENQIDQLTLDPTKRSVPRGPLILNSLGGNEFRLRQGFASQNACHTPLGATRQGQS